MHKTRPISKIIRPQRASSVAQAVETLPNKCEVLSSNPSPVQKKGEDWVWWVHMCNPSTWEAEAGELCLRSHGETLFQTNKKK
jgi:hypothetical protein